MSKYLKAKKQSNELPKTRRELVALIFKIAFLEAMALSLILPSVTSTGEIGPQTGNDSCTITTGAFFCRKTISFGPFLSPPKLLANAKSCSGGILCQHNTPFGGFRTDLFLNRNTTWINMPSTVTPFNNDTSGTYAQIVDFQKIGGFRFSVDCVTPSSSVSSPFLALQWSSNGGSTWRYLGSSENSNPLNDAVIIDGFSNNNGGNTVNQCGVGGYHNIIQNNNAGGPNVFDPLDSNLNYLTANLTSILIRVVGGNGNGLADLPVFARIAVEFSITGIINDNRDVLSNGFFCQGLSAGETITSGVIECDIIGPVVPASATISFNWQASP